MAQYHLDGKTIFGWPLNVWMPQNCLDGPTFFLLPKIFKALTRCKMFGRLQSILSEGVPSPLSRTQRRREAGTTAKTRWLRVLRKNMFLGA